MSWHPNDLVSDVDLLDYESRILTQFGQVSWQARRTKALEDWLFPILRTQGFDPYALTTRHQADQVWGYTSAVYSDLTGALADLTEDDVNLATVFATVGTDALYVGSSAPFRGLFFSLRDAVSTAAGVMRVAYWNGNFEALTVNDRTVQTAGKTLSAGGAVTWVLPSDWSRRKINADGPRYWAKVTLTATPTAAKLTQLGCIRASVLRAPATLKTLALIFREAPTGADGPWDEKAEYYENAANEALQRALPLVGSEIDTSGDEQIDTDEEDQTGEEAGGSAGGWRMERH